MIRRINEKLRQNKGATMFKRIIAILGIILLLGLYVNLFLQAIYGRPNAFGAFISAAAATIAIPIAIWLILWVYTSITGKKTVASADPYGRNDDAEDDSADRDTDGQKEAGDASEYAKESADENASEATDAQDDGGTEKGAVSKAPGSINTVIFDIGGVLAEFCWEDFIKDKGYVADTISRIAKASIGTPEWDEFDRGILDTPDVIKGFVKNDPGIESELYDVFSDLTGLLRKRERTIPWIRALKAAGYKVLVLSNYSEQADKDNPFMGEFLKEVDGGILSYKEKVIKPDRKIFELITERYNLEPSRCVFIDDMERNVAAARNFGMKAVQFEDYEQVDNELLSLGVKYEI